MSVATSGVLAAAAPAFPPACAGVMRATGYLRGVSRMRCSASALARVVHRCSGTVPNSVLGTIPGLQPCPRESGGHHSPGSRYARPGFMLRCARDTRLILDVEPAELLDALPGVHLGGEDVALPVDGDVVQRRELADLASGPAEAAERLPGGVVDDAHLAVHAVDRVDESLLRVGREDEVVDRAGAARRLLVDLLGDEAAVLAEDLQAIVDAVANENEPVLVDADAVHGIAELLRRRF